ncbi:MAG: hypothetical protein P0116_10235 [Candidatus Nitrosocosmicus sp.]|nr:hypothetical protein [Candidatus Nitrosocosmicus sp.]
MIRISKLLSKPHKGVNKFNRLVAAYLIHKNDTQAENSNKSDGFEEITLSKRLLFGTEAVFKRVRNCLSRTWIFGDFCDDPSYDQAALVKLVTLEASFKSDLIQKSFL